MEEQRLQILELELEVSSVKQSVEEIQGDVKETHRLLQTVNINLANVITLLSGNELNKADKGMIGTQEDHETRITKLETFKNKGIWLTTGAAIGTGVALRDLITFIIKALAK